MIEIKPYPRCGPGYFGIQGSGKSSHEPDRGKGTDSSFPASMIVFNPSEDIEGEREKEEPCW
jgi:hypothetical protein